MLNMTICTLIHTKSTMLIMNMRFIFILHDYFTNFQVFNEIFNMTTLLSNNVTLGIDILNARVSIY